MKTSYKIAFGGICVSLGLVLMLLTGLFPFADYALPAIAGLLTAAVLIELGAKQAVGVYAATALLAVLLVPSKESAVLYVMLFGYYGIVKSKLEQLKSRAVEWVLKFAVFNAAVLISYFGMIYIFGMTALLDEFSEYGKYAVYAFWAAGNAVFLLYDIAFSRLITYYVNIFRPKYLKKLIK